MSGTTAPSVQADTADSLTVIPAATLNQRRNRDVGLINRAAGSQVHADVMEYGLTYSCFV